MSCYQSCPSLHGTCSLSLTAHWTVLFSICIFTCPHAKLSSPAGSAAETCACSVADWSLMHAHRLVTQLPALLWLHLPNASHCSPKLSKPPGFLGLSGSVQCCRRCDGAHMLLLPCKSGNMSSIQSKKDANAYQTCASCCKHPRTAGMGCSDCPRPGRLTVMLTHCQTTVLQLAFTGCSLLVFSRLHSHT